VARDVDVAQLTHELLRGAPVAQREQRHQQPQRLQPRRGRGGVLLGLGDGDAVGPLLGGARLVLLLGARGGALGGVCGVEGHLAHLGRRLKPLGEPLGMPLLQLLDTWLEVRQHVAELHAALV